MVQVDQDVLGNFYFYCYEQMLSGYKTLIIVMNRLASKFVLCNSKFFMYFKFSPALQLKFPYLQPRTAIK